MRRYQKNVCIFATRKAYYIMSEKEIESALKLYENIIHAVDIEYKKLLNFSREFHKRYMEEKLKLPYHINVIDELHINENGHSRILLKLLQE